LLEALSNFIPSRIVHDCHCMRATDTYFLSTVDIGQLRVLTMVGEAAICINPLAQRTLPRVPVFPPMLCAGALLNGLLALFNGWKCSSLVNVDAV
jgi:hypothetical protein